MPSRLLRSLALVLAAFAFVCLSSCATASPAGDREASGSEPAKGSGAPLAIFDFDVRSGVPGYEALAVDVPASLAQAFLASGLVRPLERAALERILGELELSMSGLVDPGTAARVGRMAGARYVLLGTVAIVGDQARISCRVVDVETAELVYAGSAYGDAEDIFDIESELAGLVLEDFSL